MKKSNFKTTTKPNMKHLFLITLCALSLQQTAAQGQFVINGTLPNDSLNGQIVYLRTMNNTVIDTCIIAGNTFRLAGIAPQSLQFAAVSEPQIVLGNGNNASPIVVLEPGNITVSSDGKVDGTLYNIKFQRYMDMQFGFIKRYETTKDTRIIGEYKMSLYNYLRENMTNDLGELLFGDALQQLDSKQLLELIKLARPQFQQNPQVQALAQELSAMLSVGDKYIDVKLKDLSGKEASISDYVDGNKYILLDFWASWCGPCIKENPTLLEAYAKYRSKGFEIIGLSLDQSHDRWSQAVKRLGISWPQLSDLGYWDSLVVQTYNIKSIPSSFLLNEKGEIIAKDLRGEALLLKLEELLK
jgi:thiol-disulfide isomerase/thioredoxin